MRGGEQKYVIIPILPNVVDAKIKVKISTFSVVGRDSETVSINVVVSLLIYMYVCQGVSLQ